MHDFRPGHHLLRTPRPNQLQVFKNVWLSFYGVPTFTLWGQTFTLWVHPQRKTQPKKFPLRAYRFRVLQSVTLWMVTLDQGTIRQSWGNWSAASFQLFGAWAR